MSESNVTTAAEVVNDINSYIEAVKDSLNSLNEICTDFVYKYDEYNKRNLYDASLLKERMKSAVIKAVSDDEL